jgi:hypothetical protein
LSDARHRIEESLSDARARIDRIQQAYDEGEQLSLDAARLRELAQKKDLELQLADAERQLEEVMARLTRHDRTREVAQTMIEAMRQAGEDLVQSQVESIEPIVARTYARIDPHPSFRLVSFLTRYIRGHGAIEARVTDPARGIKDQDPFPIFSSSQLNALAVSIFLGLNLARKAPPLAVAMLDDPLQSLDDVNLLGLVDVFRRARARRQLLISAHDPRFSALLARKLRPVGDYEKTRIVEFKSWSSDGPILRQHQPVPEPEQVKVAAA